MKTLNEIEKIDEIGKIHVRKNSEAPL